MKRRHVFAMSFVGSLLLVLALPAREAFAQQRTTKDQLVGAWTFVSAFNVRADGSKFDPFGGKGTGALLFDRSGQFSWVLLRSDIPKMASNNRQEGTADEFKAVAQGLIVFFGTYVIDDAGKTLTFKVQNSSFANFNGTERKFAVTLAGDELMVSNPAGASGGSANLTWKRVR